MVRDPGAHLVDQVVSRIQHTVRLRTLDLSNALCILTVLDNVKRSSSVLGDMLLGRCTCDPDVLLPPSSSRHRILDVLLSANATVSVFEICSLLVRLVGKLEGDHPVVVGAVHRLGRHGMLEETTDCRILSRIVWALSMLNVRPVELLLQTIATRLLSTGCAQLTSCELASRCPFLLNGSWSGPWPGATLPPTWPSLRCWTWWRSRPRNARDPFPGGPWPCSERSVAEAADRRLWSFTQLRHITSPVLVPGMVSVSVHGEWSVSPPPGSVSSAAECAGQRR